MWSVYNAWSQTFYSVHASMELPASGGVPVKTLRLSNVFLYRGPLNDWESHSTESFDLVFQSILLIHCIFYVVKILFEMSLGISRYTNLLEAVNLVSMLVLIVTKYIEIGMKQSFVVNMVDDQNFVDFTTFISLQNINTITMTICTFFFPFRIF